MEDMSGSKRRMATMDEDGEGEDGGEMGQAEAVEEEVVDFPEEEEAGVGTNGDGGDADATTVEMDE